MHELPRSKQKPVDRSISSIADVLQRQAATKRLKEVLLLIVVSTLNKVDDFMFMA